MEHEQMLGIVLGVVNRRTALVMRLPSSSSNFTGTTVAFGLHLQWVPCHRPSLILWVCLGVSFKAF